MAAEPGRRMRVTSANTFQAIRLQRGLTVRQIADAAGVSMALLSMATRRQRSCSFDVADRIAAALNVPRDLLFEPMEVPAPSGAELQVPA